MLCYVRKRKLVALQLMSYRCIVTINVPWLFLATPWVGLKCVIVVFPDHTHLLFAIARGYFGAFQVCLLSRQSILKCNHA